MVCVCVKGRQCKNGSVCRPGGVVGEELYMYLESDKSRAAVKQQPHVYTSK